MLTADDVVNGNISHIPDVYKKFMRFYSEKLETKAM